MRSGGRLNPTGRVHPTCLYGRLSSIVLSKVLMLHTNFSTLDDPRASHFPVTTVAASKSHVVPPCLPLVSVPVAPPCAPANRKWILIATILGSSLAFMDGSVVNVA